MFPITEFFINNFPAAMSVFVIDAFVVAILAWLTTKAAVALKNRAGLSDGVVGGILLGIITSVPELISSIAGAINYGQNPDSPGSSILGDAIGSNMFCLFVLAVALLGGIVIFVRKEVNQINTITLVCVAVGVVFCLMAGLFDNYGMIYDQGGSPFVWHGFNAFSIFILLSYVAAVFFMIYGEKIESKGHVVNTWANQNSILPVSQKAKRVMFSHLKLWVIIVLFAIFAALLTFCSIILESSAEGVIVHFGMEAVFGRTLLLGIASSLPELTAVVSLVWDKEYNMSINSIVGSCAFNMTILFVSNISYTCVYNPGLPQQQAMFALDQKSIELLIVFLLQIIFLILYLIMNSKSMKQLMVKKQTMSFNGVLLGLTSLFYILYIVLGFVLPKG